MTPRSEEREGVGGWGEAALLPPPPPPQSSPSRSCPSPRLSPIPHAAPRFPSHLGLPSRPPLAPPPHPPTRRCSACNIHKKHTQVGATSPGRAVRRASAYLRAAAAALGKGRGRGCGGGVGGRGGPSRPSPPWASRAGAAKPPRSAPRRPGLGVSLPPAVSADAEGRCPSRA